MTTLYLFTEYFPYSNLPEHVFIKNEIKYLCIDFDKVVVVPSKIIQEQTFFYDFVLDNRMAEYLVVRKLKILSKAFLSKFFYREIFNKRISFWNYKRFKKLLYYAGRAQLVYDWVKLKINQKDKDEKILFYTFWNNEITLGVGESKLALTVSRAHGYDIYEEYYGYLPCYMNNLKNLSRLFLVSQPAVNYLNNKYSRFNHIYEKRYLGVKKAEQLSSFSIDQKVRIVSCSYIIKRKRVELIADGIIRFIDKYQKPVIWTHFGDGDKKVELIHYLEKEKSELLECFFNGQTKNESILDYYRSNPVDIFITTTELEGGVPVSIQEAQAHGIPAIGTNVGGIPEIINDKVGVLLEENPDIDDIADAIYYLSNDKERCQQMKINSILNWQQNFDEYSNLSSFSKALKEILFHHS